MMTATVLLAMLVGIAETCAPDKAFAVNHYTESLRKAGHTPIVLCRAANTSELEAVVARLDLLMLQGGEDVDPARYGEKPSSRLGRVNGTRDVFESELMRLAVRHEIPIFGTCRGEQHLNVFFGGSLYQDLPSDLGERYAVEHRMGSDVQRAEREGRHSVTIARDSRLAAACGCLSARVNSLHHQAVKGLAPGFSATAWTPDGVVEAIECGWYPAAGVQFHPECLNVLNGDPVWERFYANLPDFVGRKPKTRPASRPIGVFDSGIGGLSVLERLLTLDEFDNATGARRPDGIPDFADEDFIYFGDQANMPYGRYEAAGKAAFLRELVVRDAQFVMGSEGHAPSKIVVIACNTATAYGLAAVQAMPRPHDARVIGVVNAGAEAALDATKDEKSAYAIGVMATPATIASGVYERTLAAALKERGVTIPVEIACRGGIGLAEAVEASAPDREECARTNLVALVDEYCVRGGKAPIKALILGCTHYPFVLTTFRKTLDALRRNPKYGPLIAADLQFIDPAVYTAVACYRSLRADGLLKPTAADRTASKRVEAFLSVGKDGPLSDAVKYGRSVGCADIGTKIVPLAEAGLSKVVANGIGKSFPACRAALDL